MRPWQRVVEGSAAGSAAALLGGLLGSVAAPGAAVAMALVAGTTGAVGGALGSYAWRRPSGWAALALDSTWGIVGSLLGLALHGANLIVADAGYRSDLSRRRDRHVYSGGAHVKHGYAFTLGPVVSNAATRDHTIRPGLVEIHENLHVWQSRWFGPLYQIVYVVWAVAGFIVGSAAWLTDRTQNWWHLVETAAYYDNPFEYWAYRRDARWPAGAHPKLAWRRGQQPKDKGGPV